MKLLQRLLAISLMCAVAWCQQPSATQQPDAGSDDLKIVVISGEDGANIVKDQTFAATMVEVRDKNDLPIAAGAVVTFTVVWAATHAGSAAPGAFANGGNTLTVTAGENGRAAMTGFKPMGTGPIQVKVQASFMGKTAVHTISQTNFATQAAAQAAANSASNTAGNSLTQGAKQTASGLSNGAKFGIIAAGTAAAGVGAAYAAGLFSPATTTATNAACSNLASLESSVNNFETQLSSCENSATTTSASCQSLYNQAVNIFQQDCSCAGSPVPAQTLQAWQQTQSLAPSYGVATPANGSCH